MRKVWRLALVLLCALVLGPFGGVKAQAEVGVTDDMILFGSFQDMSGPGAYLGKMCTLGLTVWKKWVNEKLGGFHGRKVDFVVEDNKYDPVLTKTAFTKLVHQHKVFSIILVYGSTPMTAVKDDILRERIPVFPTAATVQSMFDPMNRYLFWYACSDEDNAIMMVDYIMNDLKLDKSGVKLGVVYQDDEWGKSAMAGAEIAARKYGFNLTGAPYKRGEKNLNAQAMKMKASGVTHAFFAGYAPVYASLLQEANKIGWKPVFFGDYVTVDPRTFMAGDLADGHYHFFNLGLRDEGVPGWKQMEELFRWALSKEDAEAALAWNIMPLMWAPLMYLNQALQEVGRDLTREKLVTALETIKNFDSGGLGRIEFGPDTRKGNEYYRVLRCDAKNQTFKPITDWRQPSIMWGSDLRPKQSQ